MRLKHYKKRIVQMARDKSKKKLKPNKESTLHQASSDESYTDSITQKRKVKSEHEILLLLQEMRNELEKDISIATITQLLNKRGIPRRSYYAWVEKYPCVNDFHDNLLTMLGDRMLSYVIKDTRTVHHL